MCKSLRMADEVNASFLLAGEPASHVAGWRATPPPFLVDYKRIDESYESYESLVYERTSPPPSRRS